MKKVFKVNEKRISAKYNRRIFLLNLPSISVLLSLLAIVILFVILSDGGAYMPDILYQCIVYGAYFCIAYSFVVCFIGSVVSDVILKAHKEHTYIEIADAYLVVSQHSQTVFTDGKRRSFKKLWIAKLTDIENVDFVKKHIVIYTNARYFHEDAEWLNYESTSDGIDFDNWWYNSNGGATVDVIEVTDFYTHGERIVKRIEFCSKKITERENRREKFRREMLEIARNSKHKPGISEKYVPPKQRKFR